MALQRRTLMNNSDGVHLVKLYDEQEEPTHPYCLQTIAERVVDSEIHAEVYWAVVGAMPKESGAHPTRPLAQEDLEALRLLVGDGLPVEAAPQPTSLADDDFFDEPTQPVIKVPP